MLFTGFAITTTGNVLVLIDDRCQRVWKRETVNSIERLEQYLSEDEISRPRTAEEFVCWVDGKHVLLRERRFTLNKQNLLHQGIAKKFYEEVLPLHCLLKNKAQDWCEERFKPVFGNQNYDVEIQTGRTDVPQFIEITIADMDKEENDRMQHLLAHGSVAEISQNVAERIKERIIKKMSVIKRPDHTALLIYFDDYTDFSYHREASKREMDVVLDSIDTPWGDRYAALYVVGASGQSLWQRTSARVNISPQ